MKRKLLLSLLVTIACGLVYNLYPGERIPAGAVIDRIVVLKSQRQLQAFSNGQLMVIYPVALGKCPVGAKECEGDNKTPEGIYTIFDKTTKSKFHKNLGISYPNDDDKRHAAQLGKPTGGSIKIHGLQNGLGFIGRMQTLSDWTAGCIALTNAEVDDLYEHTAIGAVVEIRP